MTKPHLFHCISYANPRRALDFLAAVGFREVAVHADEADPARIQHAEFAWRDNGGVMIGTLAEATSPGERQVSSAYLVVETDAEVDAIYGRAMAAGATSIHAPKDQDYGGRGATVGDSEGHVWSWGSYAGT